MSSKPASMYRKVTNPAYTRREYIMGISGSKIVQYNTGDLRADPKDYPVQISLRVEEEIQIRHGPLESTHPSASHLMLKRAGKKQYRMILRKFPYHVIHKNKQATGTGADRVPDEMRQSFRKTVETATRIPKGKTVFTIYCDVEDAEAARDAFRRTYSKISPPYRTVVDRGEELLVA